MKATFHASALANALHAASTVVPTRTPKDALKNVLIVADGRECFVYATDGEQWIWRGVSAESADKPGRCLVPAALLNNILRETDSDVVTIDGSVSGVTVELRNGKYSLQSADVDLLPICDRSDPDSATVELDPATLQCLIRGTWFTAAESSSRYSLSSLAFELTGGDSPILHVVGTDGKRLSSMSADVCADNSSPETATYLLDARICHAMQRLLDPASDDAASILFDDRTAIFRQGTFEFGIRQSEGKFPTWRNVIPPSLDTYERLDVVAGPLRQAIRQAQIATSDTSKGIDFRFSPEGLKLSSRGNDGSATIMCKPVMSATEVTSCFDGALINDALKVIGDETTFTFCVPPQRSMAAVLKTDESVGNLVYCVMPLTAK